MSILCFIVALFNTAGFVSYRRLAANSKLPISMHMLGIANLLFALLNIFVGMLYYSYASTQVYKEGEFITTMEVRKELQRDRIKQLPIATIQKIRTICEHCHGYGYHSVKGKAVVCRKCLGLGEYYKVKND